MPKHKYLIIFGLVIVIVALLVRQHAMLDKKIRVEGEPQKRSFSIFSALHPKNDADMASILIDDEIEAKDEVIQTTTPPPLPQDGISAEAYVVGNLETGEIYMSKLPNSVFPIASVSKLYTSLIARHVMDPAKKVTITQRALDAYGDAGHLVLGEMYSPTELLYSLVLESSNDAAEAFAESYGYGEFMTQMNAFAEEIGMKNTSFRDASGLSPGNVSSANDLFAFSRYLYDYEKPLLEITRTREYSLATTTDHGSHRFVSINPFTLNPYFLGGKTGRTNEAGESMVSLFHFRTAEKAYPIVIIVLRSRWSEREADTGRLLEKFMASIGAENVVPMR